MLKRLWLLVFTFSTACGLMGQITVNVQRGHSGFLSSARYSQDDNYLLTSAWDNSIIVWELASGLQVRRVEKPNHDPERFDFTDHPDHIITGHSGTHVVVFDWKTGREVRTIQLGKKETVDDLVFLHGRNEFVVMTTSILSGGSDIRFHSYPSGKVTREFHFDSLVATEIRFNQDQSLMAVGGSADAGSMFGGSVQNALIIQLKSGRIIHRLTSKFDIENILFHPDGNLLAFRESRVFGHKDSLPCVRFYDLQKATYRDDIRIETTSNDGIDFSPDGNYFAAGVTRMMNDKANAVVEVYDAHTFKLLFQLDPKASFTPVFSRDSRRILLYSEAYRFMREVTAESGTEIIDLSPKIRSAKCMAVSPDNCFLAHGSQSPIDRTIKIWNLETGRVDMRLTGLKYYPTSLDYSPLGTKLASTSHEGVHIWQTRDWLQTHFYETESAICSKWITDELLAVGLKDGTLKLFLTQTDSITTLRVFNDEIDGLDYRDQVLAVRSNGTILFSGKNATNRQVKVGAAGRWVKFLNDSIVLADDVFGLKWINYRTGESGMYRQDDKHGMCLAIDPEGRYAVTGTGNSISIYGDLHVWDLQNGELIDTLHFHSTGIFDLKFDQNGHLFSASRDGTIGVWDWKSREHIATFIANETDFIAYNTSAFYTTSTNGYQFVNFHDGDQVYSFDQFDHVYNRPDYIVQTLSPNSQRLIGQFRKAIEKRHQYQQPQSLQDLNVVQLQILNKETLPITSEDSSIIIRVQVVNQREAVTLVCWNNGVRLSVLAKADEKGPAGTYRFRIPLVPGLNKLSFRADTKQGVSSMRQSVYIRRSTQPAKRTLHILCLSVSNYRDSRMNLKYAVKDGRDFTSMFAHADFDEIIIDTLFDQNATIDQFRKSAMRAKSLRPTDRFILYLSGHGLIDNQYDFYFATYDVNFQKPSERGIPLGEIEQLLADVPSLEKLMLLDACHSGEQDITGDGEFHPVKNLNVNAVTKGGKSSTNDQYRFNNSFHTMQLLFNNLNQGTGAHMIAASAGDSYAYESDKWNNGVFTYTLVRGLEDQAADANRDGHVSISELKSYVSAEVVQLTKGAQQPTFREENVEFDWNVR